MEQGKHRDLHPELPNPAAREMRLTLSLAGGFGREFPNLFFSIHTDSLTSAKGWLFILLSKVFSAWLVARLCCRLEEVATANTKVLYALKAIGVLILTQEQPIPDLGLRVM